MDQHSTQPDQAELDEFLGVQPPSARSRYIRFALILLGAIIAIILIFHFASGGKAEADYVSRPVERGSLTVTVSATGNLQPTNQVDVGSELSGLVAQVLADNNDRVRKGQVLARIDTTRFADTLAQSEAAVLAARAAVGTAQATEAQSLATLARYQQVYKLSGGKVPSGTELDTARADYARALAQVKSAEAQVAQAQAQARVDSFQLSRASILSPVNGVVLSRQVEPGQTVASSFNAPVLFTIAEDLSRMKLEAKVDEADVGEVKRGQRATFTVDAFPGRRFPARINRVDVGANASTTATSTSSTTTTASSVVSYTAELSVVNSDLQLRPGMTATADIVTTEKHDVLLVPNAALRFTPGSGARGGSSGGMASMMMPRGGRRGGGGAQEVTIGRGSKQTVYIVGSGGKPSPVSVTVGDTNGTLTEVTGQLKPGDQVIVGQKAANGQ
ncbi:efflux RND transporter periplasmic adaptor subunit [Sphingomonas naphthae]